MHLGLSVRVNEILRQACTWQKREELVILSKMGQPTEKVGRLKWNKDLDSVTLKPEENSAMRPHPFLQKIRSLEPKEAKCHLPVSV